MLVAVARVRSVVQRSTASGGVGTTWAGSLRANHPRGGLIALVAAPKCRYGSPLHTQLVERREPPSKSTATECR